MQVSHLSLSNVFDPFNPRIFAMGCKDFTSNYNESRRTHTHTHILACTRNLINRDNPSKSASSIRSCSCARTYKYMYIHTHAYVFFPFDKYAGRYDLDKNTIPVARDIHRCRQ